MGIVVVSIIVTTIVNIIISMIRIAIVGNFQRREQLSLPVSGLRGLWGASRKTVLRGKERV